MKNLLLTAARDVKILTLHKSMWSMMEATHDTLDKFKKLVFEKDDKGYNLIHLSAMFNKLEVIQWIWKELARDVFTEMEFQFFIKIKADDGRNVLQLAAACNKDVEINEWLWDKCFKMFGRDGLKEMIKNRDQDERNVFHLAALSNTNEVFKKLFSLAKLYIGAINLRSFLRKKELIYYANVFDIAKEHANDRSIYPWLKTKKQGFFMTLIKSLTN